MADENIMKKTKIKKENISADDFKERFGTVLKKIRNDKNFTAQDVCSGITTQQSLSLLEKGSQIPSADKIFKLFERLNIKYDEFLIMLDDPHYTSKQILRMNIMRAIQGEDVKKLNLLAQEAQELYALYEDIYFFHASKLSQAMSYLQKSNYDFEKSKANLKHIVDYLKKVNTYHYYEIFLIGNCIFMFDIEEAVSFVGRAADAIRKNPSIYRDHGVACVLLNNMATYCLEHEEYYFQAAEYAQQSINFAAQLKDSTRATNAKIIKQVALFKLNNGQYDKQRLHDLLNHYKVLEWHAKYKQQLDFVLKHGITDV